MGDRRRFWLITVGEPLPGLSGDARPWRTGLLTAELMRRGHDVTWWTSRFDHFTKTFWPSSTQDFGERARLRLLSGCGYQNHVSLSRLIDHAQLAQEFCRTASREPIPDAILCSFPTIELSLGAVGFAAARGLPVALDVRDLWPDIFVDVLPRPLRGLGRVASAPYTLATKRAFRGATAVVGVSEAYLDWGLAKAGRGRHMQDRVFHLGYERPRDRRSDPNSREVLTQFGARADKITCTFSGSFGRTYDLAPIFAVAEELDARGFQFVVCGDGERSAEWRRLASGGTNVHFTGWLAREPLEQVLAASDVGLAAYEDGAPQSIPNKVIEYLAAGLPVVSSLRGETEKLLRHERCGLSYDSRDSKTLLRALLALRTLEERRRLGSRAL